jgi:hypothetical protein
MFLGARNPQLAQRAVSIDFGIGIRFPLNSIVGGNSDWLQLGLGTGSAASPSSWSVATQESPVLRVRYEHTSWR